MYNKIEGKSFNEIYIKVCQILSDLPDFETNPRGFKTKEILFPTIVLDDPRNRLCTLKARDAQYTFGVGEFLWYCRGSDSLEEMLFYNKKAKQYSDDGLIIRSAYGKRIFGIDPRYNTNQWNVIRNKLIADPDCRQAVIHIKDAEDSFVNTKDVPCTLNLQFFIRNNSLYLIAQMRSNDVVLGLTYDLFSFTLLQEMMLNELRITCPEKFSELKLGQYIHFDGSLHVYEQHFDMMKNVVNENFEISSGKMGPLNVTKIDDAFFNTKTYFHEKYEEFKVLQEYDRLTRNYKDADVSFSNSQFYWFSSNILEQKNKRIKERIK